MVRAAHRRRHLVGAVSVGGLSTSAITPAPRRRRGDPLSARWRVPHRLADVLRGWGSHLAEAAAATVVVVDYRLAPEDPFPAAVNNAVAAYRDCSTPARRRRGSRSRGDSAGGGLTFAALLALREAGLPQPAAAVCLSPWADLTVTAARTSVARRPIRISAARKPRTRSPTTSGDTDPMNPLASPALGDLAEPRAGARARVGL